MWVGPWQGEPPEDGEITQNGQNVPTLKATGTSHGESRSSSRAIVPLPPPPPPFRHHPPTLWTASTWHQQHQQQHQQQHEYQLRSQLGAHARDKIQPLPAPPRPTSISGGRNGSVIVPLPPPPPPSGRSGARDGITLGVVDRSDEAGIANGEKPPPPQKRKRKTRRGIDRRKAAKLNKIKAQEDSLAAAALQAKAINEAAPKSIIGDDEAERGAMPDIKLEEELEEEEEEEEDFVENEKKNTGGDAAACQAQAPQRVGLSGAVFEAFHGNAQIMARLDDVLKVKKEEEAQEETSTRRQVEGNATNVAAAAATAVVTTAASTTVNTAIPSTSTSSPRVPSDPRKRATAATCAKAAEESFTEDDIIVLDDEDEQFAFSPEPSTRDGGHPHLDLVPLLSDEEEGADLQILPETPVSAGGSEFDLPVGEAPAMAAVKSNLSLSSQAQVSHSDPAALPHRPSSRPASITPALQALIGRRRLPLVLDLDHTLLNSATFDETENQPDRVRALLAALSRATAAQDASSRLLHRMDRIGMWTKLRPGVKSFLREASMLFEIHINTMGSQEYAEQMRGLLDPTRELIKGTVVGLGHGWDEFGCIRGPSTKKLNGDLAGCEPAALILDDTAAVWAGHEENLIVCERYLFFPSSRQQFGLPGESLLECRRDESSEEGMLATVMRILRRVHAEFFARRAAHQALAAKRARDAAVNALSTALDEDDDEDDDDDDDVIEVVEPPIGVAEPSRDAATDVTSLGAAVKSLSSGGSGDKGSGARGGDRGRGSFRDPQWPTTVPEVLAEERRGVLAGVELVFSRVFPIGTKACEHHLWRLAEQFGARCGTTPGPGTTHIVAANWGTAKTSWAFERGKHVVTPQWVECSALLWKKADESLFPVRS